jgi:hypothetical protein
MFASAQEGKPGLVDEFGSLGDCDFTSRFDAFFYELSQKPGYRGYVINYKATKELPGNRDVFARERFIENHIAFRRFDRARITIIRGGYMEDHRTQLYVLPPDAEPPAPDESLPTPKTDETATILFNESSLGYEVGIGDYGDAGGIDLAEFVLESVRVREAAEQAALEAEVAAEAEPEPENSEAPAEEPVTPVVEEKLTPEEELALRFKWTEVGLAKFISTRKKATALIIFYADDQRYDIAKLKTHIEQGRQRVADEAKIKADRIKVEFGGYRNQPEIEFWFVPLKGKHPVAMPEERPVEEPKVEEPEPEQPLDHQP